MSDRTKGITSLKWKAEVTFEGTMEQFYKVKEAIEKLPVVITIPGGEPEPRPITELGKPRFGNGYASPWFLAKFGKEKWFEELQKISSTSVKNVCAIRTPHLHIGDEIALVDKERFESILQAISREIVDERVDLEDDALNMFKSVFG